MGASKSHPTISCNENLKLHKCLWRFTSNFVFGTIILKHDPTDFNVREYLVRTCTTAETRRAYWLRWPICDDSEHSRSWIGSVQLFLILSIGVVSGGAFDAGYLSAYSDASLCCTSCSRHLTIGGAVLFVFCLFMISISQPEQLLSSISLFQRDTEQLIKAFCSYSSPKGLVWVSPLGHVSSWRPLMLNTL